MQLTSVFDLSDDLAAKADPALIADDERHFAAIAEALEQTTADLSDRLEDARRGVQGAFRGFNPQRPVEAWRRIAESLVGI